MKHPFVKIHFVEFKTGKYLQKKNKKNLNFMHNNNTLEKE